jgi:hypothetical protein
MARAFLKNFPKSKEAALAGEFWMMEDILEQQVKV